MPKRKLSREEILLKKRIAERERYKKIKENPLLYAEQVEKERKKYQKKKEKGLVKPVKELTPRQQRVKRKQWRKCNQVYYKRKKEAKKLNENLENFLRAGSPPESDGSMPSTPQNVVQMNASAKSGRKRVRRDRSKVVRENCKLKDENKKLKRNIEKYRKRIQRYRAVKIVSDSPGNKVNSLLMDKTKKDEVARRLIFNEIITTEINKMNPSKKRQMFQQSFTNQLSKFKKYKILNKLKPFLDTRTIYKSNRNDFYDKNISERVRLDIKLFLEDDSNTKMAPGKKECITRKKIKKQKRYLCDSLKNLHKKFLKTHSYAICYTSFCRLRPFYIVSPCVTARDTCKCKIHTNIELLISAMYFAKIIAVKSSKELVASICCRPDDINCLEKKCNTCKEKVVPYLTFDDSREISYWEWSNKKHTYKIKSGKENTVNVTVKEKCFLSPRQATIKLSKSFSLFLQHEANVISQYMTISKLKKSLKANETLIHIDFSENYCLKYGEEIQSFHFGGSRQQITLHTAVVYLKAEGAAEVTAHSFCTCSESLKHDAAAIWAHLGPLFQFIKLTSPKVDTLHFLSDSPSTQYRNRIMFFILCNYIQTFFPGVISATWNYHEAGHGKGAPDGIGGVLKRTADKVVAYGMDIPDFNHFIAALQNRTSINLEIISGQDIIEKNLLIPNEKKIIPLFKGTLKVHQVVWSIRCPLTLLMRRQSCFSCSTNSNCSHNKHLGQISYDNIENSDENLEVHPDENLDPNLPVNDLLKLRKTVENQKLSWNNLKPGSYILVALNSPRNNTIYKYCCCIQSIDDNDGDIVVKGMTVINELGTEFVMVDSDIFSITFQQIIAILPSPELKMRGRKLFYTFKESVDVFEKG